MHKPWLKFQAQATEDWIRWANIATHLRANGPSMHMFLYASQAAEALEKLAKMNRPQGADHVRG